MNYFQVLSPPLFHFAFSLLLYFLPDISAGLRRGLERKGGGGGLPKEKSVFLR